jgi:hypothetical protein
MGSFQDQFSCFIYWDILIKTKVIEMEAINCHSFCVVELRSPYAPESTGWRGALKTCADGSSKMETNARTNGYRSVARCSWGLLSSVTRESRIATFRTNSYIPRSLRRTKHFNRYKVSMLLTLSRTGNCGAFPSIDSLFPNERCFFWRVPGVARFVLMVFIHPSVCLMTGPQCLCQNDSST